MYVVNSPQPRWLRSTEKFDRSPPSTANLLTYRRCVSYVRHLYNLLEVWKWNLPICSSAALLEQEGGGQGVFSISLYVF